MSLLRECMMKSEYFQALIPYLGHLSDEQLKGLPANYFEKNPPVDMIFRLFHARHIATLIRIDSRIDELLTVSDRFRANRNYQEVLDDIRRLPSRTEQPNLSNHELP